VLAATSGQNHKYSSRYLDNPINASAKRRQLDGVWDREFLLDFAPAAAPRCTESEPAATGGNGAARVYDAAWKRTGTLHFPGMKLDWIYPRGLTANSSGVTPVFFSDHHSVRVNTDK
jgi:hypothetical protein